MRLFANIKADLSTYHGDWSCQGFWSWWSIVLGAGAMAFAQPCKAEAIVTIAQGYLPFRLSGRQ